MLFTSSGVSVGGFLVSAGWLVMIWVIPSLLYKSVPHTACGQKNRWSAIFRYLKIHPIPYDQPITHAAFTAVNCYVESLKTIYSLILIILLITSVVKLYVYRNTTFCLCLWLDRSLQSGIRENVLQFPRIQMANCTRPPALNDKWQKSTFHPSPSLPLGCTLIFLLKVWWKAQLDVWMRAALERIWDRIMFNSYSA